MSSQNSKKKLQSLNKNELIDIIMNHGKNDISNELIWNDLRSLKDSFHRFQENFELKFQELTKEVQDLKEENKDLKLKFSEMNGLQKNLDNCHTIMNKQQSFLENLDAQMRMTNLIVLGLEEDENRMGTSDEEKLNNIFTSIQIHDQLNFSFKRLGSKRNDVRFSQSMHNTTQSFKRPILLTFNDPIERLEVLDKAKQLKNLGEEYRKIFIKTDQHPSIRREHGRLRRVLQTEKNKPENQGTNITYNKQHRTIERNGQIIDRFRLFSE